MNKRLTYYSLAPLLILMIPLLFWSCTEGGQKTVTVNQSIATDTWWKANTTYIIEGTVIVKDGATLHIEAGTLIKAMPGEAKNISMLVISKGGKIEAKGTAQQPIVFTALDDNISSVNDTSMLKASKQGLWGGIIMLGDAPISTELEDEETFYTGLNPNAKTSYYGGANPNHNGGVMEYVSIRHGGSYVGTGSESNGLTLCGVGEQTTIDNIEIFGNQDDGMEIFGGTVHPSNVLVVSAGDDGIDISQGYTGSLKNALVVLGENSDSGLELEPGAGPDAGSFTLSNIHLMGHENNPEQVILTVAENSQGSIDGLYVRGFSSEAKIKTAAEAFKLQHLIILQQEEIANLPEMIEGAGAQAISFGDHLEDPIDFGWTRWAK